MLELKNVNLQYVKDYFALCGLNVKFEKGKIYNIVGEPGSGKATLLRCIAKLENSYDGIIEYNEKNIKDIDYSCQLNVGFIPEIPVLLEKKNAIENLKYVIYNRNLSRNQEEENYLINQVLKSFELDEISNIKSSKLSYLNKQKIAFARLSLRQIDILLIENIFDLINEEEITQIKDYILKYFVNENSIIILASSKNLSNYFENLNVLEMSAGMIK